ncbi:hypothetical protein IW261DRAFT_1422541 [Armillaria novae-zelandiae]|uniref:Uncharacterized protein n=1 Tax=Armillaria novae-zelandiae TaxID=153914 RepID=A0AA39P0E6_9AGAR|nr:hypothetical protein IW261DRAFT_1422541 [Armillaria novae-zelandiae]
MGASAFKCSNLTALYLIDRYLVQPDACPKFPQVKEILCHAFLDTSSDWPGGRSYAQMKTMANATQGRRRSMFNEQSNDRIEVENTLGSKGLFPTRSGTSSSGSLVLSQNLRVGCYPSLRVIDPRLLDTKLKQRGVSFSLIRSTISLENNGHVGDEVIVAIVASTSENLQTRGPASTMYGFMILRPLPVQLHLLWETHSSFTCASELKSVDRSPSAGLFQLQSLSHYHFEEVEAALVNTFHVPRTSASPHTSTIVCALTLVLALDKGEHGLVVPSRVLGTVQGKGKEKVSIIVDWELEADIGRVTGRVETMGSWGGRGTDGDGGGVKGTRQSRTDYCVRVCAAKTKELLMANLQAWH